MDLFGPMFSHTYNLNEQIARQIFETVAERDPVIVIIDGEGNRWPSDSDKFTKLNISESFLDEVIARINDGHEPIITQLQECSVVAAQLLTEKTNCGYIMLFLPLYSPESTLANADLLEILLNQFNVIAKLIEKNSQLYELQMKHIPGSAEYIRSEVASN